MRDNLVIVGRILHKNKLIGGVFYNITSSRIVSIKRKNFTDLFNSSNIINCKYIRGSLVSTWDNFYIKKLNVYDINLNLVKKGYYNNIIVDYANKIIKHSEIISGARILNPDSIEGMTFAEKYYGQVRKMTTDVEKIAKRTGRSKEEIQKIKNYIFIDEHDFKDMQGRFTPDCAMAHSWQRLTGDVNEPIQPHDITMLNHELLEMKLIKECDNIQGDAHNDALKIYNYPKECKEFYLKLKENDNVKSKRN